MVSKFFRTTLFAALFSPAPAEDVLKAQLARDESLKNAIKMVPQSDDGFDLVNAYKAAGTVKEEGV